MRKRKRNFWIFREFLHRILVIAGAVALTLIFFMVLPMIQTLSKPPSTDTILQTVDTAKLDAPPPPPEEQKQEEVKQEEAPPELSEDTVPLDLSQLELALNPGFSEGMVGGDFAIKLNTVASDTKSVDALFSVADLDQKPRVIYQPGPMLNKEIRKKTPGTVYIIFVVDQQGKVDNPVIQSSTDTVFEKPALLAVKQWKFEPGKRNGQAVKFRMRVPVTFPKG